jgi:hypothetical protein
VTISFVVKQNSPLHFISELLTRHTDAKKYQMTPIPPKTGFGSAIIDNGYNRQDMFSSSKSKTLRILTQPEVGLVRPWRDNVI